MGSGWGQVEVRLGSGRGQAGVRQGLGRDQSKVCIQNERVGYGLCTLYFNLIGLLELKFGSHDITGA